MPILYPGGWPTLTHVLDSEIELGIVAVLQASSTVGIGGTYGVLQIEQLPELPGGELPPARPELCPSIWVRCTDAEDEKAACGTERLTRTVELYIVTLGLTGREALRTTNHAIRNDAVAEIRGLDGTTTLWDSDDRQLFIEGSSELSKVIVEKGKNHAKAVSGARVRVYTFRGIEQ